MKSLKNIVKANLSKDSFDVIYWGQPTAENFNEAVQIYLSSNREGKRSIEDRAYRKLNKQKQPHVALAILHFLDCLMSAGANIRFGEKIPQIDLSGCNSQKQTTADKSFYELYYKYLRLQSLKPTMLLIDTANIDQNLISYCEMAEQSISLIIHMDFVITHSLKSSKHPIIIRSVVSSILRRVREDYGFLSQFLSENWKIVLRKHEFSFHVNHIYERSIFLAKQVDRVKAIARKMAFNTEFPTYRFDPQTNKAIEMEMNRRQDEKKQFMSEKMIKNFTNEGEDNGFLEIASENSILIQHDEFQK